MLLALDTATRLMSIALHDGQHLLSEQTWHTGNRHTVELAPAVNNMLLACDAAITDITALAVAIGPGSYTGLRIGVSLAKGIAAVHKLPLVGMTTLDILAAGQPYYQDGHALIGVVQAGRGRIIVNTYRWGKGRWNKRAEPRLMEWDKLVDIIDGPAYITGEIDKKGQAAITEKDLPLTLVSSAHRMRRAGFLAEYAWERLNEAGDDRTAFDPAKLLPVYIK